MIPPLLSSTYRFDARRLKELLAQNESKPSANGGRNYNGPSEISSVFRPAMKGVTIWTLVSTIDPVKLH